MAAQFNVLGQPARDLFHNLWDDPDLISLWVMNPKSGTIFDRSKTQRLNGTVAGNPTFSNAITNGFYGLNLDGTGDWVDVGGATGALDIERTASLSGIVIGRPNISAFSYLVSKWNNTGGWRFDLNASSQVHFQLFSVVDSTNLEIRSDAAVTNGTDYIMGFSYPGDSVAASVALYINGAAQAETVIADTLVDSIDNALSVRIGGSNTGANAFTGIIALVALFNTAKPARDFRRWASLARLL